MAGELIRVNTAQFQRAAKKLQKASPKLARRLRRQIRQDVQPLATDMVGGIADRAPHGGGLADWIKERGRFAATFRQQGLVVGLRPVGHWKAKQFENPPFRHPVYGHRSVWVSQSKGMTGGGANDVFDKGVDQMQNHIANAAVAALKEAL